MTIDNLIILIHFFMKARFLALAALVLGLASCQQEPAVVNPVGGEVDFQLTVDALSISTRAGENGAADSNAAKDSAFGAIDYFQGANWNEVDLRYTLEVYDQADDYANAEPVKARMVQVVDEYAPVTFDLRLVPGRDYHFVVFADFVTEGVDENYNGDGLHHIIGNTLADITLKEDAINDESTDAYFAAVDFNISDSTPKSIVLRRPYGKLRVIATDMEELNLNLDPAKVVVNYYNVPYAAAFNALTGDITAATRDISFEKTLATDKTQHVYTVGYDTLPTHMTLFTDYILAENEQHSVHFTMDVYDQHDVLIKSTNFDTEIPVQRNNLTTIIGNVLTTATEVNVTIDDNFENADRQYYVFEAFVNGGEVTLTEDYVIGRPLFVEADAVLNLNGHSITNAAVNAETDVIIVREGATLTINGEGTIEAVSGNDGYAIIAEGTVIINGGTFKAGVDAAGEPNAVVYARGYGHVYVNGGDFKNTNLSNFVLNKRDADRDNTVIEARGGKFQNFDPANNAAEGNGTNFCADGFTSLFDGVDTYTVVPSIDYVDAGTYMEVYSAVGLLKWAYIVNELGDKEYGMVLKNNITLPAREIAKDDVNETYVFTTTPITVTDGVPSGSNWYTVCSNVSVLEDGYSGHIDGHNFRINGLRVATTANYIGFVGFMYKTGSVKNITFSDAIVRGAACTAVAVGRTQNGIIVENVHVQNSTVVGTSHVGALSGYNYRRTNSADGVTVYGEEFSWVRNCSTDKNTTVTGTENVGGIVGYNYGAIVYRCVNNADVTGVKRVGGVVGSTRTYYDYSDGYLLASKSTADATVTATSNSAGGVVGYSFRSHDHDNTSSWCVACQSESLVVSPKNGGAVCGVTENALSGFSGSWALYNGTTKLVNGNSTIDAIYGYTSASEATQADVDAMNAAIEAFNISPINPDHVTIDDRWVWTANGPVLQ